MFPEGWDTILLEDWSVLAFLLVVIVWGLFALFWPVKK